MTDPSTNGRVCHRAAPTQRRSRQNKAWDAACKASNQAADQKAAGFLQQPDRARGGEVGEPRRAAPVPTVGAARTPKFNAPISRLRKKHLVCAAGRKHQGVGRKRAATLASPGISICYLPLHLAEGKQGWEAVDKPQHFNLLLVKYTE